MGKLRLPEEERLPIPDQKRERELFREYKQILSELGVKTKRDLEELVDLVSDKIDQKQIQLQEQLIRDALNGKVPEPEKMPLYRKEQNGETVITNIPDDFFKWYAFIAWINSFGLEAICA